LVYGWRVVAGWATTKMSSVATGARILSEVDPQAGGVRDSKNATGPTLEFTADRWRTFLTTAR
jgi:hypothetical protein